MIPTMLALIVLPFALMACGPSEAEEQLKKSRQDAESASFVVASQPGRPTYGKETSSEVIWTIEPPGQFVFNEATLPAGVRLIEPTVDPKNPRKKRTDTFRVSKDADVVYTTRVSGCQNIGVTDSCRHDVVSRTIRLAGPKEE